MKFHSNVKKNYLYSLAYQTVLVISPLITVPYIARLFGASGVGAYTITNTVASYFFKFTTMGSNTYGNRSVAYVRDDEDKLNSVFTEIFLAQCMFSLSVLAVYILYSTSSPIGNRELACLNILYVLSGFFDISWLYYGIEKIDVIVKISSIVKILNVILIFCLVTQSSDLWLYTMIMCMSCLLNTFLAWIYAFRYVKLKIVKPKNVINRLVPLIVLFVPIIAASVYKSMDKVMLGIITQSDEAVGLYYNAEQLLGIPQGLITAVGIVMLPRISHLVAMGEEKRSLQEFRSSMKFINFLSIAVSFGIASLAPEFVPLFLGDSFEKCIYYVIMLAPCNLLISWGYSIRNQYLIPKQKDKIYVMSILGGAAINFAINILLIPSMGVVGAIVGTLIAELLVAVWQTNSVWEEIEIRKYLLDALPFALIGVFMAAVVRIVGICMGRHIYTIVLEVGIGGSFYLGATLIYLYLFDKETIKKLRTFMRSNSV